MSNPVFEGRCLPEVLELYERLKSYRHDIHSYPETGFDTNRTVGKIVEFLLEQGVSEKDIDTKTVPGCVVVVVNGKNPGKTIAVRADIDALGMDDLTTNEWKSKKPGFAHACGHDGHQTWILGTLSYLNKHNDFNGRVIGIFEAAEEIAKGANAIITAGILSKYEICEIYGAHDETFLPKGQFGFRIGPLQAASDLFLITVKGVGTHGGRPHLGVDPIPAVTEMYQAFQTIVSRKINPLEAGVLSVCSINAGTPSGYNIVPSVASIGGTVRTFLPRNRDLIESNIRRMAEGIAQAHNVELMIDYIRQIPPLINHENQTLAAIKVAEELVGSENVVRQMDPFMSSEDFGCYLEKIPGTMLSIGIRDENHTIGLHNSRFDFNDEVLPLAVTFFVKLVQARLQALSKPE